MAGHKLLNAAAPKEKWLVLMVATAYPAMAAIAVAGKPGPNGVQTAEAVSRRLARMDSTMDVITAAAAVAVHRMTATARRGLGELMRILLVSLLRPGDPGRSRL
ncbi:hypothetical protein [Streptomyces cadmiisoli]|uniref:hypothetical protein n=1 Tax=Streptomyces cadmiisoli TaxID=2184053 RepID=UPI0036669CFA